MNAFETTTDSATIQTAIVPGSRSLARTGMSRRTRIASILFAGVVGLGMFGAGAAPTRATTVGPYAQAWATCNWRYHTISVGASAGAAPGYVTQTVFYRYYIWDATLGRMVTGLGPTNYGTIAAWTYVVTATGMKIYNYGTIDSAPSTYQLTAGHRYTVVTEYWWNIGGAWVWAQAATNSYVSAGYAWEVKGQSTNGCIA